MLHNIDIKKLSPLFLICVTLFIIKRFLNIFVDVFIIKTLSIFPTRLNNFKRS